MAEQVYMLTTVDNPFNPHTQFDEWFAFDEQQGHHTSSFLARMVHTSNELPDAWQISEINAVIDEIVRLNPSGMYRKVAAPSDAA